MKDLGQLRYFLGLEIARLDKGIFVAQKKVCARFIGRDMHDKLETIEAPVIPNLKLMGDTGE